MLEVLFRPNLSSIIPNVHPCSPITSIFPKISIVFLNFSHFLQFSSIPSIFLNFPSNFLIFPHISSFFLNFPHFSFNFPQFSSLFLNFPHFSLNFPQFSSIFFNFSKIAVIRICPEQGQWPGQVIWILGISWWQASVQGSPSPYWVLLQSYATSDAISSFFLFPPTVVLCASCSDLFRFVQICSACSAFLWLLLSEATMTRKLRETGDEAIATWPEREPQIESNRNLCHKRNRGIISVVFCRWKLDFTWFYRFTSFCHV